MNDTDLRSKSPSAKALYLREWRKKHPGKNAQYVKAYWQRKDEQLRGERKDVDNKDECSLELQLVNLINDVNTIIVSDGDINDSPNSISENIRRLCIIAKYATGIGDGKWQIYLPKICREISNDDYDCHTPLDRFNAFSEWTSALRTYLIKYDGLYYRACVIAAYNPTVETVTLILPRWMQIGNEDDE